LLGSLIFAGFVKNHSKRTVRLKCNPWSRPECKSPFGVENMTGNMDEPVAREGEVLNAGQPIVTIVDLSDTWVRAAIPETYSDHIGLGDSLRVQLPGGSTTSGKVFFKSVEADFATQRDVSRRKRDIKTIVLKVRLENPKGAYVPGMTAEVLVAPEQLKGDHAPSTTAAGQQ